MQDKWDKFTRKKVPNLFLYEKQAFSYDFHIKTKSTGQKAHIRLAIYNYLSRVWIRKKKKLVCKREMFNIYRVSTMTIVRLQPFICDIRKCFFFRQNPYLFFTSFSLLWIEMFYQRNRNWFNNNLAVYVQSQLSIRLPGKNGLVIVIFKLLNNSMLFFFFFLRVHLFIWH